MIAESNEQTLLKALAVNDTEAVETIYKNNFALIQSFVLNNNGSYDEAKDIFQEAMIVLYENAKSDSFVFNIVK